MNRLLMLICSLTTVFVLGSCSILSSEEENKPRRGLGSNYVRKNANLTLVTRYNSPVCNPCPLPQVKIIFDNDTLFTDKYGFLDLERIEPGSYDLQAIKAGYDTLKTSVFAVQDSTIYKSLYLELKSADDPAVDMFGLSQNSGWEFDISWSAYQEARPSKLTSNLGSLSDQKNLLRYTNSESFNAKEFINLREQAETIDSFIFTYDQSISGIFYSRTYNELEGRITAIDDTLDFEFFGTFIVSQLKTDSTIVVDKTNAIDISNLFTLPHTINSQSIGPFPINVSMYAVRIDLLFDWNDIFGFEKLYPLHRFHESETLSNNDVRFYTHSNYYLSYIMELKKETGLILEEFSDTVARSQGSSYRKIFVRFLD